MGLTREELLKKLNVIVDAPIDLEAITKKSMVEYENKYWRQDLGNHPATSFWASNFPGDTNKCCNTRGLLYTLMNVPQNEPIPPKLRGQAEMGNAAEAFILDAWDKAGILYSSQIRIEDEETWLAGAVDALLDIPKHDGLVIVDIKSKDQDKIEKLRNGSIEPDAKHILQVQCYFYLTDTLPDMAGKKAEFGFLYYVSRQDPTFSYSYCVRRDDELIEKSVETLKQLKNNFLNGELPPVPDGHRWSEPPARWCRFKKECCKKDWKEGVTELEKSNGIEFANFLRPGYDYEKNKERVIKRWSQV